MLFVSVALAWTSFVTASWGDAYITSGSPDTLTGYGLWRRCGDNDLSADCSNLLGWNLEWYRAVQGFATVGFICVNVSTFLVILLIFVSKCHKGKAMTVWITALSTLSALCYIVAIIAFAVRFDSSFEVNGSDDASFQYGWALAICVVVLDVIASILSIVECRSIGAKILDL